MSTRPADLQHIPAAEQRRLMAVTRPSPSLVLLIGLGLLSVLVALAVGLKGGDFGYQLLQRYHVDLLGFAYGRPFLAGLVFVLAVALAVATSAPGGSVLAALGGLLFGWEEATLYVQLASIAAATGVFVLVRGTLADVVRRRAGRTIGRFAAGFNRNAFRYVFLMHLVPVLPYGMIIALPAACGVRLRTYLPAAFLGLLPSTVMLANLGEGLGFAFFREGGLTFASLFSPQIMLAALGLIALSLLPVAYRRITKRDLT